MTEVALVGATFYGNRGAEAMLSTSIGLLREKQPDLHFNVFSYYPIKDCSLVSDQYVHIFSSTPIYLVTVLVPLAMLYTLMGIPGLRYLRRFFPESVHALSRSKTLICLAGVSFIDDREKFLPFNVATILPAMLLGVPVVKFSQAVGPFKNRLNRLAAKAFLSRCKRVFARGAVTYQYLKDTFSKDFYERANDVAFLFQTDFSLTRSEADVEKYIQAISEYRKMEVPIVGVCPSIVVAKRRQKEGKDYALEISELVSSLVKAGKAVAIFPNASRGDDLDKTHNNDLPLLSQISDLLDVDTKKAVTLVADSVNASEVHRLIQACDVLVTSRFHAMVASLSLSVPVLVIGWSHKYIEVMSEFEQEDMVLDDKKGTLEDWLKRFDLLMGEYLQRKETIRKSLTVVKETSKNQIEYAANLINSNS